jgi:hypothetical protein
MVLTKRKTLGIVGIDPYWSSYRKNGVRPRYEGNPAMVYTSSRCKSIDSLMVNHATTLVSQSLNRFSKLILLLYNVPAQGYIIGEKKSQQ